jgi:CRP-like cAMP-binding protein
LYISASDYSKIVEDYHNSELLENKSFNHSLSFLSSLINSKKEKLAIYFNSLTYKKSQIIVNVGQSVQQLYILKSGELKIEKRVELVLRNQWPKNKNEKEVTFHKKQLYKVLKSLQPGQCFGLDEIQGEKRMS